MTYIWASYDNERTEVLRGVLKSKRYQAREFRDTIKALRSHPHITGWRLVRDGIVIAQTKAEAA
jgi:hypothetical protein